MALEHKLELFNKFCMLTFLEVPQAPQASYPHIRRISISSMLIFSCGSQSFFHLRFFDFDQSSNFPLCCFASLLS
ncbi:hypothetical protein FRX31_031324 [Thalictrum thalictroides]|uniref:Uncharacterized protein n=1 Tax=Thalictrum thalictroides TaxID=46969 RepID=A0A7J6V322_THATH|nr:hypothetical protein FRX31_031324 [Thalictrum thalictroides]